MLDWTFHQLELPYTAYCVNPKEMKASLLLEGKTVWESTFIKPIDTTFPESKDFRTLVYKSTTGKCSNRFFWLMTSW
jgi:hypothetical protein